MCLFHNQQGHFSGITMNLFGFGFFTVSGKKNKKLRNFVPHFKTKTSLHSSSQTLLLPHVKLLKDHVSCFEQLLAFFKLLLLQFFTCSLQHSYILLFFHWEKVNKNNVFSSFAEVLERAAAAFTSSRVGNLPVASNKAPWRDCYSSLLKTKAETIALDT